jgi:DNA-binding GntR family transcriptional regulator
MALTSGVTPLTRRRLVDDATRALRDAILDGRLDGRLRQTDLAARLGISRTPIREALGRLQHEGLIELLPQGGVRVTLLQPGEALELYDLREVLDGLAARLAAAHADGSSKGRLERLLERMARCVERRDAGPWFGAHVAFHEEILRAAGNPHLARLASVVSLSIRHFHPLLLRTGPRLAQAHAEHRAIYEAIAGRDGAAAERLARAHIQRAKAIVRDATGEGAPRHGAVQDR